MTTQTMILRLYFITDIAKEKGLIVLDKLQMIVVLTRGLSVAVFWPTTFRACIVRGMIGPYSALQPYVAGMSDLEVSEALRRL